MKIQAMANGVLREMEARGYAETTLLHQRNHILKMIGRWFDERNGGELTQSAVQDYLKNLSERLESDKIGTAHYNQLKCAILRLHEYSETGCIQFTYSSGKRKFQPSADSTSIIANALAATDLTKGFQYKLESILRQFFCFIEEQGLCERDVTRDVMVLYIHHSRNSSQGHIAYIVRSLEVLSDYLITIGIMASRPDFKFIAPKHAPHKMLPPYTEQELSTILDSIDRSLPVGKRDYAIILLAISTGLRAGDIVDLKLSDIDWKSQTINIVQGKTEQPLKVVISGQVCNAISDYILNSRPKVHSNYVFLRERAPFVAFSSGATLGGLFERACLKAGIEKKSGRRFHSLRRTFGTWLAVEEIPITTIAQMLGHTEMNSSKPYLSFNDAQIYSCAMGFDDIPLKGGVYDELR